MQKPIAEVEKLMTNAEWRERVEQLNEELKKAYERIRELEKKITEAQKKSVIWDATELP